MGEPSFWDVPDKANARVQQLKGARSTVESIDDLARGVDDAATLAELADEAADAASAQEAADSLTGLIERFDAFELRTFLSGPYDAGGALVSFQSGAGGTDASDWAQMLMRMYMRFAETMGWKTEILDVVEAE